MWTQQGPKLVGTGAATGESFQGGSVSLSGDGNTAIVGGPWADKFCWCRLGSGRGRAVSGRSREASWSARTRPVPGRGCPCRCQRTAPRQSSGGVEAAPMGRCGSGRGAETHGCSRAPSWSARVPWMQRNRELPCRSPAMGIPPSLEEQATTLVPAPPGCGRETTPSGRSRGPSWSLRTHQATPSRARPCRSPRTATPSSSGAREIAMASVLRGSGRGAVKFGRNNSQSWSARVRRGDRTPPGVRPCLCPRTGAQPSWAGQDLFQTAIKLGGGVGLRRCSSRGGASAATDIDGDGGSDLVVWRASTGTWYLADLVERLQHRCRGAEPAMGKSRSLATPAHRRHRRRRQGRPRRVARQPARGDRLTSSSGIRSRSWMERQWGAPSTATCRCSGRHRRRW